MNQSDIYMEVFKCQKASNIIYFCYSHVFNKVAIRTTLY